MLINPSDFDGAKKLYGDIFGEKYAEMFFADMADLENTYAIKENDAVVSIAFAPDRTFKAGDSELKAVYICGVATDEKHRGKKYSKKLLDYIETRCKDTGYDFAYLVPADAGLFDMYAKYGYKTQFYLNVKEYDVSGRALKPDKERWCSVAERFKEYQAKFYLSNVRSDKEWKFIEDEFGDRILNYSEDGYVMYYANEKEITVRESTLETQSLLIGALNYISQKTGAKRAKVFSYAKGNMADIPYAMVKCFSEKAEMAFKTDGNKYTNVNFE